jgi:hypothetical protein
VRDAALHVGRVGPAVLAAFGRVGNLFRPGRHRRSAAAYRATMRERAATWRDVAGLHAA